MSVEDLTNCLRAMVSIKDPLSMSKEEKKILLIEHLIIQLPMKKSVSVYNKLDLKELQRSPSV